MKTYTTEEILSVIAEEFGTPDERAKVFRIANVWLERGDGIAVYENHDLGHRDIGRKQFISFGSSAAQLETEEPPVRLPDIGYNINWRYTLIGTYKGDSLVEHR